MLKIILNLDGVQILKKQQQKSITGGAIGVCKQLCIQDFVDCREDGFSHCFSSFQVCQSSC